MERSGPSDAGQLSQGMQEASRSWKRQGVDSPWSQKEHGPADTLVLASETDFGTFPQAP